MSHIFQKGIEAAILKLERPERFVHHDPEVFFRKVRLTGGEVVADLGCGTGFFTLPAAKVVGPEGRVFAVDKIPEVLDFLRNKAAAQGLKNVVVIDGEAIATGIGAGTVDMVLMANVFHDLNKREALAEARRILRPGGRLVILDWKKMKTDGGPPLSWRFTQDQVVNILRRNRWDAIERFDIGKGHYVVVGRPRTR